MIVRGQDRALMVVMAPENACARRLQPGQVKRHPHKGPLIGFHIACPGCGYVSSHADDGTFTEVAGKLDRCSVALACGLCDRLLSIAGGVIMAVLHKANSGEQSCHKP